MGFWPKIPNHCQQSLHKCHQPGNTKGVPLTSCLTGLDQSVLQIKTKNVSCHTADSKPIKQEVNGTVILPPLVFPASTSAKTSWPSHTATSSKNRPKLKTFWENSPLQIRRTVSCVKGCNHYTVDMSIWQPYFKTIQ